jgi:hypothetical protein
MALKPAIFKLQISLSDLNRNYYDTLNLTIAQHPSETVERMFALDLAFCINAQGHRVFTGLSGFRKALKGLNGHGFFSTLDVEKTSKERGDRIHDQQQSYTKATKAQGLKGRQFCLQPWRRTGDRGQALQKRLSVPAVWTTRKDRTDTATSPQMEGYIGGQLDGMVTVLPP